jgi:hypothetical protein
LLYTDGLEEVPVRGGGRLGRERLTEIVAECGSASEVLERVAAEAAEIRDDMAACLIEPVEEAKTTAPRTEELELVGDEVDEEFLRSFLMGCGVGPSKAERMCALLLARVRTDGGVVVSVRLDGERPRVEVVPRHGESLDSASRLSSIAP